MAGKAAMMVNGPWQIPALQESPNIKWDVVTFPLNKPDQTPVAPLGGEAWTVPLNRDQAKQQKAAEFVKCLNSDENELAWAKARFTVPTKTALLDQYAKEVPSMKAFTEQVKTARARTGKLGDKWPDAAKMIYQAIQLALTGKASGTGRLQAGLAAADRDGAGDTDRDDAVAPLRPTQARGRAGGEELDQDPVRAAGRARDGRAVRVPGREEPGDEPAGLRPADVLHRRRRRSSGWRTTRPMVNDQLFSQAMVNTALFTIGSIAFQFVIGLVLALFFRRKFPLSGVLRSLLLLPWLLPLIVSSATWRSILEQDSGILNRTLTRLGV